LYSDDKDLVDHRSVYNLVEVQLTPPEISIEGERLTVSLCDTLHMQL